ncbi:MAG: sugar phosphate isomerase/epimerase [Gammaproteobacteria bacterium]
MNRSRRVAANTGTFCAPLPAIVAAVRAAGFDGLEVWSRDLTDTYGGARGVASLLREAGLEIPAFQLLRDYEGSDRPRAERLAEAEELFEQMIDLGTDTLLVCATADPRSMPDLEAHVRDLRALADLARARGLRIGFEPLSWSRWVSTYEQAWACVEAVDRPNFGLVIDTFHVFSRGSSLRIVDRIEIEKVFMVQLCNAVTMPLPVIEIARHHRRFPADGEWPVHELVQRLEARGFEGFYSIEVFNDAYKTRDPAEIAAQAYRSFCGLFVESRAEAGA